MDGEMGKILPHRESGRPRIGQLGGYASLKAYKYKCLWVSFPPLSSSPFTWTPSLASQ